MRIVGLAMVAALVLASGGAWWWHRNKRPIPAVVSARPALLIISGDTAGWITPCGCTANQSGGLLRRGSYIAAAREQGDVIYADAGGAVTGNSLYQRVKFEAILKGEQTMGLAAHNIGKAEASLGAEYLREVAGRLGSSLISANVMDTAGRAIAEPVKIVNAGGRRIALVGVLSPKMAGGAVRVTEPRAAILAAVEKVRGQYDSLIVLAYLPTDELNELTASLPEADAVIGGPTGQAIPPRRVGPTLMAAATNKGKFLVELKIPSSTGAAWDGRIVEINGSFADQEEQLKNLRGYLAALSTRDFAASETGLVPPLPADAPADYRVGGSASCVKCHAADASAWHDSHHAHAFETLKPRGFQVDPACLQCHTTGYGAPGGFESVSKSAALAGVGCESCHGPSQAHAAKPKTRTTFVAADQCVRCHDVENSPTFAYGVYWPRIQHGLVKGVTQ